MKPFKLVKITEEENVLGYDEITILSYRLDRKLIHKELPNFMGGGEVTFVPGEVYEYEYLAIADGDFITIGELDSYCLFTCYKIKEEQEKIEGWWDIEPDEESIHQEMENVGNTYEEAKKFLQKISYEGEL